MEVAMWSVEYSVETNAAPGAIWRLWADVPRWSDWNSDLESAELSGEFVAGSTIRMTSVSGESIELRIAEALEPELFVDEAEVAAVTVRTTHRIERSDA